MAKAKNTKSPKRSVAAADWPPNAWPPNAWPPIAWALLALALLVRLPGLAWGLPDETHLFSWHPDEFEVAGRALQMANTGDLHPEFFNYGTFTLYLTALGIKVAQLFGAAETVTGAHVVARLGGLLAALGTMALMFPLARALGVSAAFAPLAAAFVALAPTHVQHSAYATVDVPVTFLATACLYFSARALGPRPGRSLLFAGVCAGLAAGTKYNVGIVLLAPWLAAAFRPGDGSGERAPAPTFDAAFVRRAVALAGAALGAFLLATPFALLDPSSFWRDVSYELFEHSREGHLNYFTDTGLGWIHHATHNFPYLVGIPLALLGAAGVVMLARRRRPVDLVLLAFGVTYFVGIGFSEVRFLRYTLPLVPVLALAATVAADHVRRRSALGGLALGGVALGWAALLTAQQLGPTLAPDPRRAAAEWLDANSRPGATLLLISEPWFYTPAVTPWNGGKRSRSRFEQNRDPSGRFQLGLLEDWDLDRLERAQAEFLVASEFEWREEERLGDPAATAFWAAVERNYEVAVTYPGMPATWRRLFGGFAPHDWLYPYAEVRVWRRITTETP